MARNTLLSLVLIHFLGGCANLMQARPAEHVLAGAHEFGTTALAYTADGRRLISGGYKGELRVWDAATQRTLSTARAHRGAVRAILPLPSGSFVSGGDDGRLILWQGNQIKAQIRGADVTALALFQGRVVSGHDDGRLRVWSGDTLRAVREISLEDDVVALSVHQDQLAVGMARAIRLLNADFTTHTVFPTPRTPHDLQFSPDGRTLVAGNWFNLSVWDVASGTTRSIPTEHNGLLTSVAFSPDGHYLATLGRHTDSAIRVLRTTDFSVVQRYQAHDLCGAIIRFSPDGKMLASGSDDESVRLYRTAQILSGNAQSGTLHSSSGAIPSAH